MLAAAAAWEGLAATMHSAASSYQSELVALTAGPWLGPSSALMAAAAAPYVAWTRITAAQAEQAADQVKAAAAAYETAFAEMVPPPAIAANRSLLMALIATNLFGQNTPAIATTEGTVCGDVGAGCGRHVRLRRGVGVGDDADAVHVTVAEHQPWWAGGPSRRGGTGRRHLRRERAEHLVECPAGNGRCTQCAERPRDLRDAGILTDEEFTEQKKRLLAH
jgi:hypothetical protein